MRSNRLLSILLVVLLGIVLVVADHNGYWSLLHLALCMSSAIAILYVSQNRAEDKLLDEDYSRTSGRIVIRILLFGDDH